MRVKSKRNQLILLGLICQAFSWDDYFLPLISAIVWLLCLTIPRKHVQLGQFGELAMLVVGAAAAYYVGNASGVSTHFFIGHGLSFIQVIRLMRPLKHREKIFSILIACFQIGVACTVILDYRFLLIFLAALILIPRALIELELEETSPEAPKTSFRLPIRYLLIIALATAVFYIAFPRGFLGTGIIAPAFVGASQGSLNDAVLDPSRSGSAASDRVLLQIEGKQPGYLRCFALVHFDGQTWTAEKWDFLQPLKRLSPEKLSQFEHRRVRVKNANYLTKTLPSDGFVVDAEGKFFRSPARNQHGAVKCQVMWNTANNVYEYWTDLQPHVEFLNDNERKKYTDIPPQSERLKKWLDEVLAGINDPLRQARRLESYLQSNFKYNLGAPALNRLNSADDFIFNQRQGHCERFAANLALLLRMKGIPSRVVIGYLPGAQSWVPGRYNVRFKDAHAWTEAWFPEKGWVQFDATPAATIDRSGNRFRELFDTLDFVWYSNVVAFDAPTQSRVIATLARFFGLIVGQIVRWKFVIAGLLLATVLLLIVKRLLGRIQRPARKREKMQALAEHFYGQMLQALARRGFDKLPQETPLEFLERARRNISDTLPEIELITNTFCEVRYGNRVISTAELDAVDGALRRIRSSKPAKHVLET